MSNGEIWHCPECEKLNPSIKVVLKKQEWGKNNGQDWRISCLNGHAWKIPDLAKDKLNERYYVGVPIK